MHSPLHAVITSRATPWLLLAMTLAATAFSVIHPRPTELASPQLAELSARIRDRGRAYVDGVALVVSGDRVMGRNLIASATDRMTVLAEDCARTAGCDSDTFTRALRGAIDERSVAMADARATNRQAPVLDEVATALPASPPSEYRVDLNAA